MKRHFLHAVAALLAFLGAGLTAHAQTTYTWDGGGGDDNWGTGTNWSTDTAPTPGSSNDLVFAGTTRLTPNGNYTAWDDFRNLIFSSGAGAFTVGGVSLDLFGKIENDSSATQTVSLNSFSFNSGSAELNPVNGNLVINGSDIFTNGNTINVWGNNGYTLTVNALISQGGGLTVNQNSNVVLTAANTYTGTTTISAGSLRIGNGGTTGTLGTGGVTNNAALVFNRSNDFTVSNTISGSGTVTKQGAGVLTLSGSNSYTGATSINNGTISISAENNLGATPGSYVANQLSLNGGTLKTTAGVSVSNNRGITLSGTGGTLDSSGIGTSANFNINSKITGTGNLTLKANGDTSDTGGGVGGNLGLLNTSNDFVGNVTIQSGVVNFSSDASFGNTANTITIQGGGLVATDNRTLPNTRSIILSGGGDKIFRAYGSRTFTINGNITGTGNVRHTDGGTLQLNGNNSFTGNLISAAGSGRIVALGGTNTYTGYTWATNNSTIRLDADNTLPDTTTVLLYGGTTFNVNGKTDTLTSVTTGSSGDTTVTVNLGSGANLTVTGNSLPSGMTSGYGNATVHGKITGTGNITYNHATTNNAQWDWFNTTNDFTGTVTVTQGRLRVASDAVLGNAANDLVFNGTPVATLGNQEGKASLQIASAGNLTLGAGRDIILNTGKEGTMYAWGSYTMTINGKVTGGGNLRKEDGGVLLLNNTTNDYTGLTRIASGTLRLGAAGVLPDASGVEIAGGNLDLNALSETVASLSGSGGAVNGGGTLRVLTSGTSTYSGVVQGGSTLLMAGSGTQTIAGTVDNDNGWAAVSSGTLVLGKTSSGSVHSVGRTDAVGLSITGGTARLGGSGNDQIYTRADVSQTAGTFDFNGRNEGFRGLIGSGGTVSNSAPATTSSVTVGESTLVTDSFTYAGAIQDGAGVVALTKTGPGTQTLSGANTFTGTTTVAAGVLALSGSGSLASATIDVQNGATLDLKGLTASTYTVGDTGAQVITGRGTVDATGKTLTFGGYSELRPGASPGTLALSGNIGFASSATLTWELNAADQTTGGSVNDLLSVTGNLTLDGILNIVGTGDFSAVTEGTTWTLMTYTGTLADNGLTVGTAPALSSGREYSIDTSTPGSILLTVIPEPSITILGLLGVLGLVARRRRI